MTIPCFCKKSWPSDESPEPTPPHPNKTSEVLITVNNLDVKTPDGSNTLISNLSFDLEKQKNLLISGRSSSGKTSLLRVISGIWPRNLPPDQGPGLSNTVRYLTDKEVYYLPQRSFMSDSGTTLRQLIAYPDKPTYQPNESNWIYTQLRKYSLNSLLNR